MLFDKDTIKSNTLYVLENNWTEYIEMLSESEQLKTMVEKFEKIVENKKEFVFWQMHMDQNANFILHSNNNLYGIRGVNQYMSERWSDFDSDADGELLLVRFEQCHADNPELSVLDFQLFQICNFGDESKQYATKEYVRMYGIPPKYEVTAKFCRLDWDKYFRLLDLIASTDDGDFRLDEMIEKEFEFK